MSEDRVDRLRAALWAAAAYFDDEECGRDSEAAGLAFAEAMGRLRPEDWGPRPAGLPWSDPYTGDHRSSTRNAQE